MVRYTLKYQADGWEQYFQGVLGRLKFHARHGYNSFTTPQELKFRANQLDVPKIGWLVLRGQSPYPEGHLVSATVFSLVVFGIVSLPMK